MSDRRPWTWDAGKPKRSNRLTPGPMTNSRSSALVFIAALVSLNRVVGIYPIPLQAQPFPILPHDHLQAVGHVLPTATIHEAAVSQRDAPHPRSADDGDVGVFDALPVADLDLPTHFGEQSRQSQAKGHGFGPPGWARSFADR